jgi:O-antigen/teichoic acid export membrane protein
LSEDWVPAGHGSEEGSLQRRVARGLAWTLVDTWGRQLITFAVFLVLARLLVPDDFGLVALAVVFVNLVQLVVDQGMGDALIQRREVTRSHIDTAFWVAIAMGVVLTVAGLVLADPIALVLDAPGLAAILRVLSLTFVLSAVSSIQIALLRRELAFRSLAMRSIVAALGGGAVGIGMALAGFGAWALVGQLAAAAALSVVTLWSVSPWRPGLKVSREQFRELFGFGINVVGSDLLNYLSRNTDTLLIGAVLGTTPLGFYAVGYRILDVSQTVLVQVARKVTFPAFSKLQHDPERMVRAYFRVTRAAAVVILPGYVALALVATELTIFLFGSRWAPSGPVAGILFLIGPILSVQAFNNALLNAAGRPDVVLRFRFLTTVVNVIGFAIAVWFGILAVAAAFVIRGYLLMPVFLVWMQRYAGVPVGAYLRQLWRTAAATLAMAAAIGLVKLLAVSQLDPTPLLAAELGAAALTFVAALWLFERALVREVLLVVSQAIPGLEHAWGRLRRPATERSYEPPAIEQPEER